MSTSSELLLERVRAACEDEYTIDRELGRGGMAAVFLARDIALQRRVAIKVMLPDLIDVEGIADRFVIEARTSAHLDHPGIVTVYSVKQRAGLLFIVMKYIEGRTLESVLTGEKGLETSVIMEIVSYVAEALHFAHTEGVIHRDVKPSNIIIDTKGRPVVTDFGIAKIQSGRSITVTGSMIGTPAYMSPEQCRGLPATAASDQYALGVMMYEMLARHLPFDGTIFELINAHCNNAPPPLAERAPGIDPALDETVTRMLAKNPRERWPALSDVAKRLGGGPGPRRSSDARAIIAALARAGDDIRITPTRRVSTGADVSNAATELATTPAPQLVVTPPDPSIEVGATVQLRVSESSGASLGGYKITWKSEDPTIATVDDTGVVTGRSVGFAKITASGGAAFGRVAVTVKSPSVDTLVVTPQNPDLVAEHELQFVATALDARGTTLMGQPIVWQSSDVSVCAVSGQGRAIGIAPGKATITATCGEVSGTAQVKVRLPGVERVVIEPGDVSIEADETRRLTATVFGPQDRKLAGRTLTWRSTVPTVVTVDADGTIMGVAPGTAAVMAECDGRQGLVSVSVRSQPIVAVRIQPERLQLEAGRSLQLKGIGEDRRGRSVTEKGIEWHSDDDRVALVDASGKVHAVREGRTIVHAIAGDVTSSIEVSVVPREAAQIRIDGHPPSVAVGEFLSLDATVLDADGVALQRDVVWKSDNEKAISVSATGVCEGKRPGSVRITATCDRARATTKINVTAFAAVDAETEAVPVLTRRESSKADSAHPAPARRRSRAVPIGAALVFLTAIGVVWASTRNGAKPSAAETAPPPVSPNSASTPPAQRPDSATRPVTQLPGAQPPVVQKQATEKQVTQSKAPAGGTPGRSTGEPPAKSGGAGTATNPGTARGAASATGTASNPPRRDSAAAPSTTTRRDSAVAAPPPVVTPPVTPPPRRDSVVAAPPPASQPAGRSAAADAEATRTLLCSDPKTPASVLTETFGNDPLGHLDKLYVARDAADLKEKASMLSTLKDAQGLHATVSTVRAAPTATSCDWLMKVTYNYVTSFGAKRNPAWQMAVRLEMTGGSPHVTQIFGATKQ